MTFAAAMATCECHARSAPVEKDGVVITLERTACLGSCPNYKVTIQGDGRVQFTTDTAPANAHRRMSRWNGVLVTGATDPPLRRIASCDTPARYDARIGAFAYAVFSHRLDPERAHLPIGTKGIQSLRTHCLLAVFFMD